jgi:hypothetical protein
MRRYDASCKAEQGPSRNESAIFIFMMYLSGAVAAAEDQMTGDLLRSQESSTESRVRNQCN